MDNGGVRVGAEHSNRAYAWPATIVQPARPPRIVFLDLLHWIALSKVVAGHRDGASTRPAWGAIEALSLDWGILRAFGRDGILRVMHVEDGDVTAESRARWPGGAQAFDSFVTQAQLGLQRSVLDGPADERDAAALRSYGFDPRAGLDVTEWDSSTNPGRVRPWAPEGEAGSGAA